MSEAFQSKVEEVQPVFWWVCGRCVIKKHIGLARNFRGEKVCTMCFEELRHWHTPDSKYGDIRQEIVDKLAAGMSSTAIWKGLTNNPFPSIYALRAFIARNIKSKPKPLPNRRHNAATDDLLNRIRLLINNGYSFSETASILDLHSRGVVAGLVHNYRLRGMKVRPAKFVYYG